MLQYCCKKTNSINVSGQQSECTRKVLRAYNFLKKWGGGGSSQTQLGAWLWGFAYSASIHLVTMYPSPHPLKYLHHWFVARITILYSRPNWSTSGRAWASPEYKSNNILAKTAVPIYVCVYVCMYVAVRRPMTHARMFNTAGKYRRFIAIYTNTLKYIFSLEPRPLHLQRMHTRKKYVLTSQHTCISLRTSSNLSWQAIECKPYMCSSTVSCAVLCWQCLPELSIIYCSITDPVTVDLYILEQRVIQFQPLQVLLLVGCTDTCSVPCSTASSLASLEPSGFDMEALWERYIQESDLEQMDVSVFVCV